MESAKISQRQLAFLIFTVLVSTMVFIVPRLSARVMDQDAWLIALLSTIPGGIIILIMVAMWRRFPDRTLTGYLPLILGKPLGLMLGILYAAWFLLVGSLVVNEFALFMNSTIMPMTPAAAIIVPLMALVFYALRLGVESWVRANEILIWAIVASLLVVIFLPVGDMDLRRLLPIGDHSLGQFISSSLIGGDWRGEAVIVGMFLPLLATAQNTARNLLLAILFIGVFLVTVEVSAVAVFGGAVMGQLEFPIFSLARMISVARIIDRMEVLVVGIWVLAAFFKVCAFMYCAVRATAESLGYKDFQFLAFPLLLLASGIAINISGNVAELEDLLTYSFLGFGLLTFELVIPGILLFIAVIRSRRERST